MLTGILFLVLCAFLFSSVNTAAADDLLSAAEEENNGAEKTLSIRISFPGKVLLTGGFAAGDMIRLYSREYRSADAVITDKLQTEMAAEKDGSAEVFYNITCIPLL